MGNGRRWRVLACGWVVVALAVGCTEADDPTRREASSTPNPSVSPSPSFATLEQLGVDAADIEYLQEGLDYIRDHSVYVDDQLDWSSVRTAAIETLGRHVDRFGFDGLRSVREGVYEALNAAIAATGDAHGSVRSAERVAEVGSPEDILGQPDDGSGPRPEGEMIADGVGLLRLPRTSGFSHATLHYSDTAHDVIRGLAPRVDCGWIVDLRGNSGGNGLPMVQAVGPFLAADGDVVVSFVGADDDVVGPTRYDEETAAVTQDGEVPHADRESGPEREFYLESATVEAPADPVDGDVPVAVLVDRFTASAAEMAAIALIGRDRLRIFGEPTAGLTTGVKRQTMPDGASIGVSFTFMRDRTGRTYDGPIEPGDTRAPAEQHAIEWLRSEC